MGEYFPDHRRVFDTGDDGHLRTVFTAAFNVDIECPLQTPGPAPVPDLIRGHRCTAIQRWGLLSLRHGFAIFAMAKFRGSEQPSMLAIGCNRAMKPREVYAGSGNQYGEPGNEVQRFG